MSRIGKRPIELPSHVSVTQRGGEIQVKGPKGTLSQRMPDRISFEIGEDAIRCLRADERKPTRALHGLARALVQNMVTGVSTGFWKDLEIVGVGYRAEASGGKLVLQVGFSHSVEMPVPKGLQVSVEANTKIRVEGIDKQAVGQFSADVRAVRPPEPYKGKGIRYVGEYVRHKVGKAAVGTA